MSSLGRVLTGECAFTREREVVPNASFFHSEGVPGRDRAPEMSQPGLLGNFSAALILSKKCQLAKTQNFSAVLIKIRLGRIFPD